MPEVRSKRRSGYVTFALTVPRELLSVACDEALRCSSGQARPAFLNGLRGRALKDPAPTLDRGQLRSCGQFVKDGDRLLE